jgi:ribosomal protein S18 acetylase RimI-like enzyme
MPEIRVRKMRESDLNTVSELAMLANPQAVKEKYREHVMGELKQNPDLSFVAVDGEKVVGYAQIDTHGMKAILEDIAVAKEYQGKGVGKRLLEKELRALRRRRGTRVVFAEVHYKCASAIPFYYKCGFRISGSAQDHFGIDHDVIILKLILNQH